MSERYQITIDIVYDSTDPDAKNRDETSGKLEQNVWLAVSRGLLDVAEITADASIVETWQSTVRYVPNE